MRKRDGRRGEEGRGDEDALRKNAPFPRGRINIVKLN